MEKKISVVIPTYKRPELLTACIRALSVQDLEPSAFEVIVVSDGPDHYTQQVVESWQLAQLLDIRYLPLPEKKGPAAARNAGWKAAKAPLIAFTDDDTLPDRQWLSSFLIEWKGAPVAFTGKVKVPISSQPTDYELNTAQLEKADFVTANCAVTKDVLVALNGFDERFEIAWREDSDLEFRLLAMKIPIIKLDTAIVVHPVRKAAWGVSIREQKKNMWNALLYKKYPEMYRQKIQPRPAIHYYIMILSVILGIAFLLAGWLLGALMGMGLWLFLVLLFIRKRLAHTSRHHTHIAEMILTSMAIPFVAIYWSLYGAWRYRVLFL